ncbi:MAG: AAA family ATPase [Anaerolineae bacterium]|nr:AAA family ATPase [Anaerolineae bacterium]
MSVMLLTTKLTMPPLRPRQISREPLVARLNRALEEGARLTLISAPAGFGKTTLTSEWAHQVEAPVVWLSLDDADNDPVQFLSYLIAAFQQVNDDIGRSAEQILHAPQMPPLLHLMGSLINDIAALGQPLVLVLDDFHRISLRDVNEMMQLLIDRQPPTLHLVICTREDPALPLAQLRARGELTEVRQRDLRLSVEETDTFLADVMGLHLTVADVQALETRTEGWVSGLQLAALAIQKNPDETNDFIAAFTGGDRYIMDYLVSEVLERQPGDLRDFLRQTSVLDRLTASLCDAVTGRTDSQALLEHLDASNIFVVPLDHQRTWYRYHHLFVDVLRATLSRDEQIALHARAMGWYEAQADLTQAIGHAQVVYRLTGDDKPLTRLICAAADETLNRGGIQTLRGWLDLLPDARIRAHGELATYNAWVAALSGAMNRAEDFVRAAETQLDGGREGAWGRLFVLRGFLALLIGQDYAAATANATDALARLDPAHEQWRLMATWVLSEAQKRAGDLRQAIATMEDAERRGLMGDHAFFGLLVQISHVSCLYFNGQRRAAIERCELLIERLRDPHGGLSALAGLIWLWLGRLHYEANDFEQAAVCFRTGAELNTRLGLELYTMFELAYGALLQHARGETDAALDALRGAHQLALQTRFADAAWFPAWEANIRLQCGDVEWVENWAHAEDLSIDEPVSYMRQEAQLAYARLLVMQGEFDAAEDWLARQEAYVRAGGLERPLMTIKTIKAVAAQARGQRRVAVDHLAAAVTLAAPEQYARVILDEDRALVALLPQVRDAAPRFVDGLLNSLRETHAQPLPDGLLDALSEREQEILQLIADGLTNADIGERLFIAVSTVKRHINHIYDKLDVETRTQAVAKARTLGLVEG